MYTSIHFQPGTKHNLFVTTRRCAHLRLKIGIICSVETNRFAYVTFFYELIPFIVGVTCSNPPKIPSFVVSTLIMNEVKYGSPIEPYFQVIW